MKSEHALKAKRTVTREKNNCFLIKYILVPTEMKIYEILVVLVCARLTKPKCFTRETSACICLCDCDKSRLWLKMEFIVCLFGYRITLFFRFVPCFADDKSWFCLLYYLFIFSVWILFTFMNGQMNEECLCLRYHSDDHWDGVLIACYGLLLLNDTNCNKCLWMLIFLVDQFNISCYQFIRAVSTHSRKRQIDDEWSKKKRRSNL